MIEDLFDDELGLISARREYFCDRPGRFPHAPGIYPWGSGYGGYSSLAELRIVVAHHPGEVFCGHCGQGPILWDQGRYTTYVLKPWIIEEEP